MPEGRVSGATGKGCISGGVSVGGAPGGVPGSASGGASDAAAGGAPGSMPRGCIPGVADGDGTSDPALGGGTPGPASRRGAPDAAPDAVPGGAGAPLFRLREFDEVTSTNEVVKHALEEGEPEGLAVRARCQSGGYGRQGRTWASPEGGLYLSLLLRPHVPPAQLPTLSLVAGLAVREAAVALAGGALAGRILIKWPNDVVVAEGDGAAAPLAQGHKIDDFRHSQEARGDAPGLLGIGHAPERAFSSTRSGGSWPEGVPMSEIGDFAPESRPEPAPFAKLCGISLEAHAGGVCVGIGVNVTLPAASFEGSSEAPPEVGGKNRPAYLADVAGWDRVGAMAAVAPLAHAILDCLAPRYALWCEKGFAPLRKAYEACAALEGRPVRMVDRAGAAICEGTACGVDDCGRLLVMTDGGGVVPVSSGEAHVLNR